MVYKHNSQSQKIEIFKYLCRYAKFSLKYESHIIAWLLQWAEKKRKRNKDPAGNKKFWKQSWREIIVTFIILSIMDYGHNYTTASSVSRQYVNLYNKTLKKATIINSVFKLIGYLWS